MKKLSNPKGFTLVELAIVMVIIGLLIGAVLKGQAMIDDAKIKRTMNDIQGISAAYFSYYDRYNALPGDDTAATARWAGVNNGNGNGFIAAAESVEALQALRFAGLLSGDPAATTGPGNPYAGTYTLGSFTYPAPLGTKNRIVASLVPGSVAQIIDSKFDDGVWDTGTVQGSAVYTGGTVTLYNLL